MSGPPPPADAGARLLEQRVVAVAVKTGLAELARFAVLDAAGREVGEVRWDGAHRLDRTGSARRRFAGIDGQLPQTLVVRDAGGVVLVLTRPRLGLDRVLLRVDRADGSEVGAVVGSLLFGGRTRLVSGGRRVGTVRRVRDRGRVPDGYDVTDASGAVVARIVHDAGPPAPRYVTEIPRPLADPLAGLVLAAALSVDTALTAYSRLG
ncbi:scramblase [Blastococcus sp. SYSU D00813]